VGESAEGDLEELLLLIGFAGEEVAAFVVVPVGVGVAVAEVAAAVAPEGGVGAGAW
jgi:hypothetical protein